MLETINFEINNSPLFSGLIVDMVIPDDPTYTLAMEDGFASVMNETEFAAMIFELDDENTQADLIEALQTVCRLRGDL